MPDSDSRSRARTLGRRLDLAFPTAARTAMAVLSWLAQAVRRVAIVSVWGVCILVGLYLLAVLNWAPLWARLYSDCMTLQREANTVTEIFRHRAQCMRVASQFVKKAH